VKFKTIIYSLGWLLFLGCLGLALAAIFNPTIADGVLWRFEKLERVSNLTQRSFEARMERHYLWRDELAASQSTSAPIAHKAVFFGDSHLHLIPPDLTDWAVNLAISGQPISRMINRVQLFKLVKNAPVIFINGGENDLKRGDSVEDISRHWKALLAQLPKSSKIVCVGLPETKGPRFMPEKIKALNESIAAVCAERSAKFLPLQMGEGAFAQHQLANDNIHLSPSAMLQLALLMKQIANQP
jgi:GDSL-like Lipase/Acylhydrolase family